METKKVSGSEAVILSLLEEGVETIFGYPGGAIMPIYDLLYDYQDKLKHILTRHEQGAAHAAQGYARVTGKVGVCMVTSHSHYLYQRTGCIRTPGYGCVPGNGCHGIFHAHYQMEYPDNQG